MMYNESITLNKQAQTTEILVASKGWKFNLFFLWLIVYLLRIWQRNLQEFYWLGPSQLLVIGMGMRYVTEQPICLMSVPN